MQGVRVSLHPPSKPVARVIRKVWGIKVSAAHTRRPRILRLEVSKPKGSNVGAGQ